MIINKKTIRTPPPPFHGVSNLDPVTCLAGNSGGASHDTVVNTDCFNEYDPSLLDNIDTDINYLISNKKILNTPYYNNQSFSRKYNRNNYSLPMLHLNIRGIWGNFLQLTSLLNNLNLVLKIAAISEISIKTFHIYYNIPNYNIEQDFRLKKTRMSGLFYLNNIIQNIFRTSKLGIC